jgi:magnesium transporter
MDSRYSATASVDEAVARAVRTDAVAWIGGVDPSLADVEEMARRLGLGEQVTIELERGHGSRRVPRTRIARLDRGVYLVMLGLRTDDTGAPRPAGQLELLATPDCVAVFTSELPEHMRPPAIRERLEPSLAQADATSGGVVLGLVVSQVLERYEDLLDGVEEEAVRIADEVFVSRSADQLKRIYALSRPVHAAVVGMQPLLRGLEEDRWGSGLHLDVSLAKRLESQFVYLSARLQRVDAVLSSAQQSFFNLAQDEANSLMERQANATRKMSGYALLIAIPTIIFSLYGTNFDHVPLLGEPWGYGAMLAITVLLFLIAWWRLRKSGWI